MYLSNICNSRLNFFSYIKNTVTFRNFRKEGQGQLFGRMEKDRHIAEKGFVQKFINVSDFAESQGELYLLCTNRYFTSKAFPW
jgi:hypothetical protein